MIGVERSPDLEASTLNAPPAAHYAGVARIRGYADQAGDLATSELAELGQISDQRGTGDGPNAMRRLEQPIEVGKVSSDMPVHVGVDVVELALDGLDHHFDARVGDRARLRQALPLHTQHGDELPAAGDEGSQILLLGARERLLLSGKVRTPEQRTAEARQAICVNAVRLGERGGQRLAQRT